MEDRKIKLQKAIKEHKALTQKMREEEINGGGWPEEWLLVQHNLENEIRELAGAGMIIEMYDKLVECRNAIKTLSTENEKLRSALDYLQGQGKNTHHDEIKH